MKEKEVIKKLDRIERMLFTLLDEKNKKIFNDEKVHEYQIALNNAIEEYNRELEKTKKSEKVN